MNFIPGIDALAPSSNPKSSARFPGLLSCKAMSMAKLFLGQLAMLGWLKLVSVTMMVILFGGVFTARNKNWEGKPGLQL